MSRLHRLALSLAAGVFLLVATGCTPEQVSIVHAVFGVGPSTADEATSWCNTYFGVGSDAEGGSCTMAVTARTVQQFDLNRTAAARQCIMGHESSEAGLYLAENGISTASGAYQFVDGTWNAMRDAAAQYYQIVLSPAGHASWAPPGDQDLVATYTLLIYPYQHWAWTECHDMVIR